MVEMKFKVLEFSRRHKKGLEKLPGFDLRKATVEITVQPFLWFMKPKTRTVQVYNPYANWKYTETGGFCEDKLHRFLEAYEELNEL